MDVLDGTLDGPGMLQKDGVVPICEQMAIAAQSKVEIGREVLVNPFHNDGERVLIHFHDEMDVVVHDAVGQELVVELGLGFFEQREIASLVVVVDHEIFPVVDTADHVIIMAGG